MSVKSPFSPNPPKTFHGASPSEGVKPVAASDSMKQPNAKGAEDSSSHGAGLTVQTPTHCPTTMTNNAEKNDRRASLQNEKRKSVRNLRRIKRRLFLDMVEDAENRSNSYRDKSNRNNSVHHAHAQDASGKKTRTGKE